MGKWIRWTLLVGVVVINVVVVVVVRAGKQAETERAELAERRLSGICNATMWRIKEDLVRFDETRAQGDTAALQVGNATDSYTGLLLDACRIKAGDKAVSEWEERRFQIGRRYMKARHAADLTAARAALVEMHDLFAELEALPILHR